MALSIRHLSIGLAMLAAAGLASALTPRLKLSGQGPEINFEAMIPNQFGEWKLEETVVPLIVSPEMDALVDRTYDQTLSRNYINGKGVRIMLSIAYVREESRSMQVHLPEVCYVAQGFQVGSMSRAFIDFSGTKLPVMKLVATRGQRIEPITYWIVMGDFAVRGKMEQSLARIRYGLEGQIPSGMLIRVSTISGNHVQSYKIEEQFLREMLGAVPMDYRRIFTGVIS